MCIIVTEEQHDQEDWYKLRSRGCAKEIAAPNEIVVSKDVLEIVCAQAACKGRFAGTANLSENVVGDCLLLLHFHHDQGR